MGVIAILLFILFLFLPGLLAPDPQEDQEIIPSASVENTNMQSYLETRRDPIDRDQALRRLYKDRGYDTSVPKADDLDAMRRADITLRLKGIEPEPEKYNVTGEFASIRMQRHD